MWAGILSSRGFDCKEGMSPLRMGLTSDCIVGILSLWHFSCCKGSLWLTAPGCRTKDRTGSGGNSGLAAKDENTSLGSRFLLQLSLNS